LTYLRALGGNWRGVLALLGILGIAAVTRGFQLSQPGRMYFDEFYAQDGCVYLGWPQAICGQSAEGSWMHPPLGKWLIAAGEALFGFDPIAWRLAAVCAGIVMVGLVYLLARRLIGSALGAALAAALIALDPQSIASSRIAMLDIFTACAGVATVLFVVLDLREGGARHRGFSTFFRPWRIAAGIAAGAATATKWSGVLSVALAVFLTIAWEVWGAPRGGDGWLSRLRAAAPSVAAWLIILPFIVYTLTYTGRLGGEILAVPWEEGAWFRQFAERQREMLSFHLGLEGNHPFSSPAWSWLLAKRPVVFLHEMPDASHIREILALVDPLIWLPGLGAAIAAAFALVRRGSLWGPELVISAAVAMTYLPWLVLAGGRSQVFAYYVLPTLPFMAVALGWAAARLPRTAGRTLAGVLGATSVAVFVFWSPLLYGWPID
jgi:dolichyl-phosphate-mannose-protein mannosyltransferase